MTTVPHAILPLAVLESVRQSDGSGIHDVPELEGDFSTRRLGLSTSVQAQIERYQTLARKNQRVTPEELTALLTLVDRRSDADLVFAVAGRWAARWMLDRTWGGGLAQRSGLPGGVRKPWGFRVARRAAREVFAMRLERRDAASVRADLETHSWVLATPSGRSCKLFGAGVTELLRSCTGFEGAMFHTQCSCRGDDRCLWQSGIE